MKTVVVYASKYGATKRYAGWIAEAVSGDLYERSSMKAELLKGYDTIVYGGGLYAGGVSGIKLLTQNFDSISGKNLVVFTCGLADPSDQDNVNHIRAGLAKVLTPEMREKIRLFHLRGGMDYSKLSMVHRAMMAMLHKMVQKKDYDSLRPEDRQMLDTYGQTVDFTDRASIQPIVGYLESLGR